jgi:O-antigen/teichoic acid export membrane protein
MPAGSAAPRGGLARNAVALIASAVGTGFLGLVFWLVAANLYSPRSIGRATGEITAAGLMSSVCQLNWTTVYPRFCHRAGPAATKLLTYGYAVTGTLSLAVAALFVVLGFGDTVLPPGAFETTLFIVSVPLWTIFTLQDAALTGLRAAVWVPLENGAFGVAKLILLVLFVGALSGGGVYAAWILPLLVTVLVVNAYLYLRLLPAHAARSEGRVVLPSRADLLAFVGGEYVGGLALTCMETGPILIVIAVLGATQNAYFSIPWLVGSCVWLVLLGIATPLMVESTADPERVYAHVRGAIRMAVALLVPGCLVVIALAPVVLSRLGSGYAHQGTAVLRLVVASSPFAAVNLLYITLARMARRVRRSLLCQVALAVGVNGTAAGLVWDHGIVGAGLALVIGQGVVALVVLPSVVRQYRALRASAASYPPGRALGLSG